MLWSFAIISFCHEFSQQQNLHSTYPASSDWRVHIWQRVQHSVQNCIFWANDMKSLKKTLHVMIKEQTEGGAWLNKAAGSIISQPRQINEHKHTLCHAPVSVRQSTRMQSGAAFYLSLTPSMQTLPLLYLPVLGSPWQQDHTMQKQWSGSEGNTKDSAHKASQCSKCTLLRRHTTWTSQQF